MKQGKVFEKLIARKNVKGISFQDKTCTVLLTDGSKRVCGTAHEARLFIEGKLGKPAPVPVAKTPARNTDKAEPAKCGTEAPKTIEVDANWLIERTGGTVRVPQGAQRVRLTAPALAAVVLGSLI